MPNVTNAVRAAAGLVLTVVTDTAEDHRHGTVVTDTAEDHRHGTVVTDTAYHRHGTVVTDTADHRHGTVVTDTAEDHRHGMYVCMYVLTFLSIPQSAWRLQLRVRIRYTACRNISQTHSSLNPGTAYRYIHRLVSTPDTSVTPFVQHESGFSSAGESGRRQLNDFRRKGVEQRGGTVSKPPLAGF